jgi:hypothetical protein
MKQDKIDCRRTRQAKPSGGRERASWTKSYRWGIDERWAGTSMICAASGRESFALSGDYDVTYRD